jgi:uncharacterized membrane protein YqjE
VAAEIDLRDRDAESLAEEHSLGELVSRATNDLSLLVRKEVELAKAEVRQDVSHALQAGAFFGAAGVLAVVALIVLSMAGAWALALVIATPWAFLAMGGFLLLVAGICGLVGRAKASAATPVAEQTVETLEEDVKWAKAQIS